MGASEVLGGVSDLGISGLGSLRFEVSALGVPCSRVRVGVRLGVSEVWGSQVWGLSGLMSLRFGGLRVRVSGLGSHVWGDHAQEVSQVWGPVFKASPILTQPCGNVGRCGRVSAQQ